MLIDWCGNCFSLLASLPWCTRLYAFFLFLGEALVDRRSRFCCVKDSPSFDIVLVGGIFDPFSLRFLFCTFFSLNSPSGLIALYFRGGAFAVIQWASRGPFFVEAIGLCLADGFESERPISEARTFRSLFETLRGPCGALINVDPSHLKVCVPSLFLRDPCHPSFFGCKD